MLTEACYKCHKEIPLGAGWVIARSYTDDNDDIVLCKYCTDDFNTALEEYRNE